MAKKLGLKPGHLVAVLNEPDDFRSLLGEDVDEVQFESELGPRADVIVTFHTERSTLEALIEQAEATIHPSGALWVAWPKKASKVPTDIAEDVVRHLALGRKLVDNKVCAISEIWSGLRLVWRKEHR